MISFAIRIESPRSIGNAKQAAHRPNPDGTPRLLNSSGGVLHIPRGEYRRIGDIAECAFVCNCFVAQRDILQAIRWDEDLKVDEHWDFFWRAKIAGVRVGVAMDHVFPHIHVDPPATSDIDQCF